MKSDIEKINLTNGMIDSHFHLFQMQDRGLDASSIMDLCFNRGLWYALDIGIRAETFEKRTAAAAGRNGLYTAHGLYPSECTSSELDAALAYLEKCLLGDGKAVALGEVGLDFYRMQGTAELQQHLFTEQLKIAERLKLPVIVHSRDAGEETLRVLTNHRPSAGGIIHCYSYSAETARKFMDLGFYISFAGNITYKKSLNLQEAAVSVPLDRLLIETDAPYLSPAPVRGLKNHPGYIGYTYEFISELKNIPLNELIEGVRSNFKRLFKLS